MFAMIRMMDMGLKSRTLMMRAISLSLCGSGMMGGAQFVQAQTLLQRSSYAVEAVHNTPHSSPSLRDDLYTNETVQNMMRALADMREKNNERLIHLTEIAAPPFEEQARALALMQAFKDLGLGDARLDGEGNLLVRRVGTGEEGTGKEGTGKEGKGEARTIAVVAHIDTVFPRETDVSVRREGDIYYAPGIGDNSRGLVAMLALAEVLQTHQIKTQDDILFVGSVGEEGLGDLRGVRHLFGEDGEKIDSFIAIDGGANDRLVVAAVGSNRYRVSFEGPGGHSYGHFGRAHPHQALARAISLFYERATPITQTGPRATFSVGRIGGGTSINSIPFTSWMEVDMRSVNAEKLGELDAAFHASIEAALQAENEARRHGEALRVEVKSVGRRPAGESSPGSSLVRHAVGALNYLGFDPQFVASSTDANIPISLGVPSVTMARGGRSQNAHAPNESWEDVDAHIALQALLLTVLAEADAQFK